MRTSILKVFFVCVLFSTIGWTAVSCDSTAKLIKSKDAVLIKSTADKQYEREQWGKAYQLYSYLSENMYFFFRGDEGRDIKWRTAMSCYNMGDVYESTSLFRKFISEFPYDDNTEMAFYYYCLSLRDQSPDIQLDQAPTKNAIQACQLFLDRYSTSPKVDEIFKEMRALQTKMRQKDINAAKLYYTISNYQAAAVALRQVIAMYPGMPEAEELHAMAIESYYLYALNSIESKQVERYKIAILEAGIFLDLHPASSKVPEVQEYRRICIEQKDKVEFALNKEQ